VLVPPGEQDPLARALIELLEDEARRHKLGEGARKVAERYSWEPIARRLLTIYEELQDEGVREQAAA
jgi:glycosyltransferase involved in cell wall biosynthesis